MRSFKVGRFVKTPHGIGVVFDISRWPDIDVHLINKSGETVKEKIYNVERLQLTAKPLKTRTAVD